jgi:hypothetical protein
MQENILKGADRVLVCHSRIPHTRTEACLEKLAGWGRGCGEEAALRFRGLLPGLSPCRITGFSSFLGSYPWPVLLQM